MVPIKGGDHMKITYRPHRGGYIESMQAMRVYNNIMDMLRSIVRDYDGAFTIEDISISYYAFDPRNDWNTFIVCTRRLGDQKYDTPAPIGWCRFE